MVRKGRKKDTGFPDSNDDNAFSDDDVIDSTYSDHGLGLGQGGGVQIVRGRICHRGDGCGPGVATGHGHGRGEGGEEIPDNKRMCWIISPPPPVVVAVVNEELSLMSLLLTMCLQTIIWPHLNKLCHLT